MTGSGSYPMPSFKSKTKSDPADEDACSEEIILHDGKKYGIKQPRFGYTNEVSRTKGNRNNSISSQKQHGGRDGEGIQVTTTYEINPSSEERIDGGTPGIGTARMV